MSTTLTTIQGRTVPAARRMTLSEALLEGHLVTFPGPRGQSFPAIPLAASTGRKWLQLLDDECYRHAEAPLERARPAEQADLSDWCLRCEPILDEDGRVLMRRKLTAEAGLRRILAELARLDASLTHTPGDEAPQWERRNQLVQWAVREAQRAFGADAVASRVAGWRYDPDAPEGFQRVGFIQLPTGQVSWHVPEAAWAISRLREIQEQVEAGGRDGLLGLSPIFTPGWDGHTREEKARRIAAYLAT